MSVLEIVLLRHGESIGNVAREEAEATGAEVIPMPVRDPDVPLSDLGREQAGAVGRWLDSLGPQGRPGAAWASPYERAFRTAALALDAAGFDGELLHQDERLRDRELGVLDLLTTHGVRNRFPDEATRRTWLGKFYYRPPGGESWADVALRVRSFLDELDGADRPSRALIVTHDAVIMLFRYVCEGMDERQLMATARAGSIRNCSATTLVRAAVGAPWRTEAFNEDGYLEQFGSSSSDHPGDVDAAVRA